MPGVPGIIEKYQNTQDDLLYNILSLIVSQTGMPLTITQYYPSTTHDLLGNVYLAIKNLLSTFLAAGAVSYNIPPNMIIDKFLIIAPTPINFKIGTTVGGNEILDTLAIAGRQTIDIEIDGGPAGLTIYFTGVLPDTLIKPFIR